MVARARSVQVSRWRRTVVTVLTSSVLVLAPLIGVSPAWAQPASPAEDAGAWCRDSGTTARLDSGIPTALQEAEVPGAIVGCGAAVQL